jgi:rhodanese-related sulfurtransferase
MEITPAEVKRQLDAGVRLNLIDVRQPEEYQIARIDGSELIPMDKIPGALDRLEQKADEAPLIVICHHGVRSANVVNYLRGQGIPSAQSLTGGIERWSLEVDPSVPRY